MVFNFEDFAVLKISSFCGELIYPRWPPVTPGGRNKNVKTIEKVRNGPNLVHKVHR